MPQSVASDILTNIFHTLNQKIDYLVLRNFVGLPDSWENDVDLLVAPAQHDNAVILIEQYLKENGLISQALVMKRYGLTAYKIHGRDRDLRLDLFYKLNKAWIEYADVAEVLRGKRVFSDIFYVPHNNHAALLIAAKELFAYGRIRNKYNALYQSVEKESLHADALALFRDRISSQGIELIIEALISGGTGKRPRPSFSSLVRPCAMANWVQSCRSGFVQIESAD